jgi:hypothetical protein
MLERGMEPGEALRAAQNNIRQRPGWHSPYYWAAFTIQGKYDQVIKPPDRNLASNWKLSLAVAFLVLTGPIAWYGRRRWLRRNRFVISKN